MRHRDRVAFTLLCWSLLAGPGAIGDGILPAAIAAQSHVGGIRESGLVPRAQHLNRSEPDTP